MDKTINRYTKWVDNITDENSIILDELNEMRWDKNRIDDAFGTDLKFGTSGLRGIMGAGTNRMNNIVVRKVSQGICEFLKKTSEDPSVVIAYDTRENSFEFAVCAAEVFCGNGIPVFIFNRTVPVSLLSYSIPRLGAAMGIMITASHNSREYNGYKVYGAHGHQILEPIPEMILEECEKIDEFEDVKSMDIKSALTFSLCAYVEESLIEAFLSDISSLSKGIKGQKKIVYTPLNGAGLEFIIKILKRNGLSDLLIVENQTVQDGKFETCTYPNPEKKESFKEAIKVAEAEEADYIIATDPDCDRFGMAVKTEEGFRVLTGNEIGILMFNYILKSRKILKNSICYKSIVSTPLLDNIAKAHKVDIFSTLIGFKYIGEKIYSLDDKKRYAFGMEESHGYLIGPYCWDKDGVGACLLAAEMIDYYANIPKALEEIYEEYGYVENRVYNFVDNSFGGKKTVLNIMEKFRNSKMDFDITDFLVDETGLEPADILKFTKEDVTIYVRPSGTEPKLKIYIFASGKTNDEAKKLCDEMYDLFELKVKEFI